MRIALACLMTLHGMAHMVTFVEAWRLMPQGFPYKTTILSGRVDLGHGGTRVLGVVWLLAMVAFVVAAGAAVADTPWWMPLAAGAAATSLLLSATELPQARAGVGINSTIIVAIVIGRWFAWL
jgi:hypothetical protein